VRILRERGNDVFVVLGPFNEHIVAEENRAGYRRIRDGISGSFARGGIAFLAPETLPSGVYADASHPLTEGYGLLAGELYADKGFRKWLGN
jgi:hypothetical protein